MKLKHGENEWKQNVVSVRTNSKLMGIRIKAGRKVERRKSRKGKKVLMAGKSDKRLYTCNKLNRILTKVERNRRRRDEEK